MAAAAGKTAKLFVARLPWSASRESLWKHFVQFGPLRETKVIFDMNTGRSKKFGFVVFRNNDAAETAVNSGPHHIEGKEIAVLLSDSSAKKEPVKDST
eukprot:Seg1699.5 transcript_id=Seg1699.5/GoldUCD/mRNA.D3Y31 product="hypothetical protein" pseudo=true protein_id=Seg1699.5/GoldUCD/D3Y31